MIQSIEVARWPITNGYNVAKGCVTLAGENPLIIKTQKDTMYRLLLSNGYNLVQYHASTRNHTPPQGEKTFNHCAL